MMRCMRCMNTYNGKKNKCPHCGHVQNMSSKKNTRFLQENKMLTSRYLINSVLFDHGWGISYIGWDNLFQRKVVIQEYMPEEYCVRAEDGVEITIADSSESKFQEGRDDWVIGQQNLICLEMKGLAGIPEIYSIVHLNKTAYGIRAYYEGETLKQRLQRGEKWSSKQKILIITEVANILKQVNQAGIYHKNVSPEAIFLCENRTIYLLDFAPMGAGDRPINPGYTPKELYEDGEANSSTEVYSLSATLYWMLTGVEPIESPKRNGKNKIKSFSELNIMVNKSVENAVLNGLEMNPRKRTKTVEEFYENLVNVSTAKKRSESNKKASTPKKQWKPSIVAMIVFVGCFSIVLIGAIRVIGESSMWKKNGEIKTGVLASSEINTADETTKKYINVVGKSEAEGKLILEMNKFMVITWNEHSEEFPDGVIIAQDPENVEIPGDGSYVSIFVNQRTETEGIQETQETISEAASTEEHPTEEQPTEEQPTEEQPTEEQPTEESSASIVETSMPTEAAKPKLVEATRAKATVATTSRVPAETQITPETTVEETQMIETSAPPMTTEAPKGYGPAYDLKGLYVPEGPGAV